MPDYDRVAILGSGAMGSMFGGRMAERGIDVTLLDVWDDHVQAINEDGLRLVSPEGTERTIDVPASTDPSSIEAVDLVVVFVKGTQTKTAMADAAALWETDPDVLTLQNGLGNPEIIAESVPSANVLAGVTGQGATLLGPGHVKHAGEWPTTIGAYFDASDERVAAIADLLRAGGFETDVTDDIHTDIWEKVCVNIGLTGPSALSRARVGTVAGTDPARRLVRAAVREVVDVAAAEGYDLRDDIVEYVIDVGEATAENKSSMLQDVEAGRETEIERLHGEVVRRGEVADVAVPVNRTIADLVRLAEHRMGHR